MNTDIDRVARLALDEDLAGGVDVTTLSTVDADATGEADFVAREAGVVAGLDVAAAIVEVRFAGAGTVKPTRNDGETVAAGDTVLSIAGPTREILTAERSALNILCHLSGIATTTAHWVAAVDGTGATIRDTRKTMPGLRALEKYAVRCGGGQNHRKGLADQALIKDNHIVAAGGVTAALKAVQNQFPDLICEVECDTVDQVAEAIAAGAKLVLLDNMTVDELVASVGIARPAGVKTEASGGLTIERAREVAQTGVDYLSVGALTHSAASLDIGLDLR
jgi:nicotinate-nucleotide pyrophosphorylase (carboxylating)